MLGQIGLPGGGVGIGYGSNGLTGNPTPPLSAPSLPMGSNPIDAYIPAARIADMLLNPGVEYDFNGERRTYPDIRLMYWAGGNPFHKHQDINRLLKAWQRPETIIVQEPWWTPTARRADIVLPVTTTLERNDIAGTVRDRFFVTMQRAVPPVGEARNEYDIFSNLADRLDFGEIFTEGRDEMGWLRHMYDVARQNTARQEIEMPSFDDFWRDGYIEFPVSEDPPVLLEAFRADPQQAVLKTPSGRIEIFSDTIDGFGYDDCPGHPAWLEPAEWLGSDLTARHPMHLISNQPRHRLHSQMDFGAPSQASKVQARSRQWFAPPSERDCRSSYCRPSGPPARSHP